MADLALLRKHLEARGFLVTQWATAQEAADYLDREIDGTTVAFGGSVTLQELELYPRLTGHNRAVWHWEGGSLDEAAKAAVYVTSANGVAETGELINIDGHGNRAAATLYGRERVYFVVGRNKVAPDFQGALWRARNIAAPKNARRLQKRTPCALRGDRCYDCASPERICRGLVVLWGPPTGAGRVEVVLVDQDLGY